MQSPAKVPLFPCNMKVNRIFFEFWEKHWLWFVCCSCKSVNWKIFFFLSFEWKMCDSESNMCKAIYL